MYPQQTWILVFQTEKVLKAMLDQGMNVWNNLYEVIIKHKNIQRQSLANKCQYNILEFDMFHIFITNYFSAIRILFTSNVFPIN